MLALRNNLRSCEKLIPASVCQFAEEITGKTHSQIRTPDHLKSRHAVILIGLSRSLREAIEETKNYKALGERIISLVKAGLAAPCCSNLMALNTVDNQRSIGNRTVYYMPWSELDSFRISSNNLNSNLLD